MYNLKKHARTIALIISGILITACGGNGGGGSSSNTTNGNTPNSGLKDIVVSSISEFPAHAVGTAYIAVVNNSGEAVTNLNYSLIGQGKDSFAINSASQKNCATIPAHQQCIIGITALNSQASSGQLGVKITTTSAKQSQATKTASSSKLAGIGLMNVISATQASGADGIHIMAPASIALSAKGITPLIVNTMIMSTDADQITTLTLVDSNNQPISYARTISGNNPQAGGFAKNSIVSFEFDLPKETSMLAFKVKATDKNGNSSYSPINAVAITSNQANIGILPTAFILDKDYVSQELVIANSGSVMAKELNLTANSTDISVSKGGSIPCGNELDSGEYCTYLVSYDKAMVTQSGSALLTASYTSNGTISKSYATVRYYADANSMPSLGVVTDKNNFISTTASPIVNSLLVLTNDRDGYVNSKIVFKVPEHFSLAQSGTSDSCSLAGDGLTVTNSLAFGQSCRLKLIYNNPTATAQSVSQLTASYTFDNGSGSRGSANIIPINLIYTTIQSTASLSFSQSQVDFTNISANSVANSTQLVTLINNGQVAATNLKLAFDNNDSSTFHINSTDCGASLEAGGSCKVNLTFGPTASANRYTSRLTANYQNGSNSAVSSTVLSGIAVAPHLANIVIANVTLSPAQLSGDGLSNDSAFQVDQKSSEQLTLTYQNIASDKAASAASFTINSAGLSGGYSVNANNCNNVNLAANGGSCQVILNVPTTLAGPANLDLMSLTASWTADGVAASGSPSWQTGNSANEKVYINVNQYPLPGTLSVSLDQDAMPIGQSVSGTVSLNGSKGVADLTVSVQATNYHAFMVSPTSCTLSSEHPSCSFTVTGRYNGEAKIQAYNPSYSIANSKQLISGYLIYATTGKWTGNLLGEAITAGANSAVVTNGIAGADYLCQQDSQCPAGAVCKAIIVDDINRSAVPQKDWVLQPYSYYINTSLQNIFNSTTNANAIASFPLANAFAPNAAYQNIWTGFVGEGWTSYSSSYTCNEWGRNTGGIGSYGNSTVKNVNAIASTPEFNACNTQHALYCVQQPN